jgi:hypothetical protein
LALAVVRNMVSAWSCLGLVATFNAGKLMIFDPTLSFCDPNYRWELEFEAAERGAVKCLQWNSVGSHLLVLCEGEESSAILLYTQSVH